jgi:serine/threonine protein kinase
MRPGVLTSVQ